MKDNSLAAGGRRTTPVYNRREPNASRFFDYCTPIDADSDILSGGPKNELTYGH
jgi:hypothetical protein